MLTKNNSLIYMKLTTHSPYFLLFGFSLFLVSTSFVLQYYFHLEPCPLCIIDRVLVMILTIFYAAASIHNPDKFGQKIYSIIGFIISLLGILSASRHLWIIHLPPEQVPACGPGIQYLFDTLPPHEALMLILQGSGECYENKSQLLGISIPLWTLLSFVLLAVGSLLPWWANKK